MRLDFAALNVQKAILLIFLLFVDIPNAGTRQYGLIFGAMEEYRIGGFQFGQLSVVFDYLRKLHCSFGTQLQVDVLEQLGFGGRLEYNRDFIDISFHQLLELLSSFLQRKTPENSMGCFFVNHLMQVHLKQSR